MALDAQGNEVGKLFVGGLHQSTNTNGLHNYFSKFGDIEESIVMMDNRTGRSRGFGYVKFKEPSAVDQVLSEKVHVIDNKEVDPKRCNINMRGKNRRSLKIFVGGIAFEHDEETIRTFFQSFGNVTDVNLLSNPGRPRHRGFAFVGFDDEEVVKKLIKMHYINLNGKQVEIKPMEPPNPQKTTGYMSPSVLNVHNNGRPVRGSGRINSIHSHVSYGSWNQWSHSGSGGNGVDIPGGVGGTSDNSWNHILNHHALTPWGSQLPPPWNGPASSAGNGPSSSPLNGCWDNQMAAAAAAAFQSNGFTSPQQQWGSQQSSNRRPASSGLHRGGIDHTLMDYNSWGPHQSGVPHHQNHPPSASDHFSQHNTVAGASCGASGGNFTSTWGVPSDTANQWGAGTGSSAALWGSGTTAATGCSRHDQNDSACSTGLGSATNLGVGTSVTAFKMDDDLYRAASGGGNTNVTGISFPGSGSDWQSALAVATVTAQQRSVLAAAAASQFKR
uniref:RRM domain-containing protein n=2 Tax=Mesocestoides corti TaxID=53468 RepID=A0A5K3F725_MESCO